MIEQYNFRVLFTVLLLSTLIGSCTTNPVTGKRQLSLMSESQEVQLGETYYGRQQQSAGGKYVIDPDLNAYVSTIGRKLAKHSKRAHLPYEFVVLNDSTPNAWALPGGKIAINRGLLSALKNEAELAAVLAHEIVHADAGHSAQAQAVGTIIQVGQTLAGAALDSSGFGNAALQQGVGLAGLYGQTRHSRSKELEADEYGIHYMVAAGYDPKAAVSLQETFVRLSGGRQAGFAKYFQSHPPSIDRVRANEQLAWSYSSGGFVGQAEYELQTAKLRRRQPAYDQADKALVALGNDDYKTALALAEAAIKLEPREGSFYEIKGFALENLNRSKDALTAYDSAVRLNNGYYSPLLKRGLLNKRLQSNTRARDDLIASAQLAPSQIAYFNLGEIEEGFNNCSQAKTYFDRAAAANGEYTQAAQQRLAALQLRCQ